ncbi:T9SS type A sorting domain-containing protein [Fulvivirga sp. 29W222]|uniref:T9SS type A sorting domain-containing protein n=1 Tax=Fulvivirga marina TaxID=2494733 RepID=A0A937G6D9_9BACT|nr:T9SS type A sorting domain-containing protein [Fulvivirga marina]MBL6449261.1 T9SS type A sorting domain-containing protein [Fulvivirga marina]
MENLCRSRLVAISILVCTLISTKGYSQCTGGYSSGDLTVSSACTISADITITGNLSLLNSASLVISPGVTVTVLGDLQTGYMAGTLSVSGGGALDVAGRFYNDVRTSTSFTFSNVAVTVGNNGGTSTSINNYTSTLSLLNGTSFTVTGGNFENDNGTSFNIDNSSLDISSGNFINDFQAETIIQNGGVLNLSNGNLVTEDQSHLLVDNSTVAVSGDLNNDFHAQLDVQNNSTFTIGGDFNNGYSTGGEVTTGYVNIDGSNLSVGGSLNNDYGSDINIDGGGTLAITNDLTNDQAATIDIPDGSLIVGGTITDDFGGIGAPCSNGCCGNGCVLPVTLVTFDYDVVDDHVVLSWMTASEVNNDYFTIEKSYDGELFEYAGRVSGSGTTDFPKKYYWEDVRPLNSTTYFRLKQTDLDGTIEYKGMVTVGYHSQGNYLTVSPNPVSSGCSFKVLGENLNSKVWKIQAINGLVVAQGSFEEQVPDISTVGMERGVYMLNISSNTYQKTIKIVIE